MSTHTPSGGTRVAPVHVVGAASTAFAVEHDAMLDELVFEAVSAALRECGLRKQDLGLSVTASMDVLDGRSISSGLTNAAAGGYLNDSFRVEGDSGLAIINAAQAIAAGDVEVAVAVGVHNPEISGSKQRRRAFLDQVSNLGFDPHFDRPVGMTGTATYAMHAGAALGELDALAAAAAGDINRGAGLARSVRRDAVTAADVLESEPIAWPLRELMLPAESTGAVAIVLASPARAGRCIGRNVRLTGFGHATGGYTWDGQWLTAPQETTRRAGDMALAQAGRQRESITLAEVSAVTPALQDAYVQALGLNDRAVINPSGGLRSNYPGLANGALRLLEVMDRIDEVAPGQAALSHSIDVETGLVAEDVTVLVVEAA
ncbi:hypothetical protein [Nocardia sp. NPDC057272]|uniref:hypothetical protein n=1 Tax=Nocardia sp. NPDC057272 TaxID=3346079 RepID=UPI00362EDD17